MFEKIATKKASNILKESLIDKFSIIHTVTLLFLGPLFILKFSEYKNISDKNTYFYILTLMVLLISISYLHYYNLKKEIIIIYNSFNEYLNNNRLFKINKFTHMFHFFSYIILFTGAGFFLFFDNVMLFLISFFLYQLVDFFEASSIKYYVLEIINKSSKLKEEQEKNIINKRDDIIKKFYNENMTEWRIVISISITVLAILVAYYSKEFPQINIIWNISLLIMIINIFFSELIINKWRNKRTNDFYEYLIRLDAEKTEVLK